MYSSKLILIFIFCASCVYSNNVTETSKIDNQSENSSIYPTINRTTNANLTISSRLSNNNNELSAQSQEIHKSIELTPINGTTDLFNKSTAIGDFRPSPHFETYYEFNKFPVVPALPEAKHLNYNFGEFPKPENIKWPVTEQPWTAAKVKFPTKSKNQESHDHDDKSHGPSKFDNFEYGISGRTKEVNTLEKPAMKYADGGNWNKYERKKPHYHHHTVQKNQFDFSAPVEVPYSHTHKTHYDYGVEKPYTELGHSDYWKKIIKFLTAIIPIGLLISALTPTVISVTPMNGTQTRSRAEDTLRQNTKRLVSSLNYFDKMNSLGCEDRILCELLVSASTSKNAEEHVQNLLNTFTDDGKVVDRPEDMKKVFAAVRKQNCEPIRCRSMKDNT